MTEMPVSPLLRPRRPLGPLSGSRTLCSRLLRAGAVVATLAIAACGGGGGGTSADPEVETTTPTTPPTAPPTNPPTTPPTTPPTSSPDVAITALSVPSLTVPWDTALRFTYSFTVTNRGSTVSTDKRLYAGMAETTELPHSWTREGGLSPIVDTWGADWFDIPALAPGESVTLTRKGNLGASGGAWSLNGYLDACLFTPDVQALTGCNATPVTMAQVDPVSMPLVKAPGYGGEFPHAAAALDATPTRATSVLMAGTFGWDRPGPFSWSPTLTDDQTWSFTAANGVNVDLTMPWATFIESIDFAATAVTLAPADGARPLPFGTVLAAFDLSPASLLAHQSFTLRFTVSDAVLAGLDARELVIFGADSDGTNLRLLPLAADVGGVSTGKLTAGLRQFGIVGLATMSRQQREALVASWPRDSAAQIEAALGAASVAQRAQTLGGSRSGAHGVRSLAQARETAQADDPRAAFIATSLAYYNDIIVPAFVAAYGGGEAEIEAAMPLALGWLRQQALLGLDQDDPIRPMSEDLWTRVNDLVDRHADKVKQRCTAGGGFAAFQRMLAELRQLELLGHAAKAQELAEALGACSSFTAEFHQAWSDQNTNAALVGGVEGSVTLTAPTANMIKAGSLPHGDGDLAWTTFRSSTTDTFTNYDANGNVVGNCATTTTGTGTTGSKFTLYIKDYGLSFLKGGGHRPLTISLWPYGTYNGQTHIPMGIHYRSTSTCNGAQDSEWEGSATPEINDPGAVNRGDGMRILSAPWSDGAYTHEWSVTRSGDLHPTNEQLSITVRAGL